MKYIFDFDDVLFNNTKQFKKYMYECLEKVGISKKIAKEYYQKVRKKEFSLKNFVSTLLAQEKVNKKTEDIYKDILSKCKDFVNIELLEKVKEYGKENCFIVSNGEEEFQKDKIKKSGIAPLFSQIFIVPESKKEVIYDICEKYKDEKIFFIDDKIKIFNDLDISKYQNLKTILYKI